MAAPTITESEIIRPFVVSVDADIPDGASVRLLCEGRLAEGGIGKEEFVNPWMQPTHISQCESFGFELTPIPGTLTAPFLNAVCFEGDGIKTCYTAEAIADQIDLEKIGLALMPGKDRFFITKPMYPGTFISYSVISRPWRYRVVGWIPTGCRIELMLRIGLPNNEFATITAEGITEQILPFTNIVSLQPSIQMFSSPDQTRTPMISGLVMEGDGRRFFWPAIALMRETPLTNRELLASAHRDKAANFDTDAAPQTPSLPSAIERLEGMFRQGEFKVEEPQIE